MASCENGTTLSIQSSDNHSLLSSSGNDSNQNSNPADNTRNPSSCEEIPQQEIIHPQNIQQNQQQENDGPNEQEENQVVLENELNEEIPRQEIIFPQNIQQENDVLNDQEENQVIFENEANEEILQQEINNNQAEVARQRIFQLLLENPEGHALEVLENREDFVDFCNLILNTQIVDIRIQEHLRIDEGHHEEFSTVDLARIYENFLEEHMSMELINILISRERQLTERNPYPHLIARNLYVPRSYTRYLFLAFRRANPGIFLDERTSRQAFNNALEHIHVKHRRRNNYRANQMARRQENQNLNRVLNSRNLE